MTDTAFEPAIPLIPQQLCPECFQALVQQAGGARHNAVGLIQWCGHRGVHALVFRGRIITAQAATVDDGERLDRAYTANLARLIELEQALLAALGGGEPAN